MVFIFKLAARFAATIYLNYKINKKAAPKLRLPSRSFINPRPAN